MVTAVSILGGTGPMGRGLALRFAASDIDGVIVSAFGDPGRKALAERLEIPVVGIGEAAAIWDLGAQ